MPPAFNLSQDQTLQFDLEILLNGIEVIYHFSYRERLQVCENLRVFRLVVPHNWARSDVLLTRSPLATRVAPVLPFDLHV